MKKPNQPETQIQQILYCLITRISIDRRQMMTSFNVLNLTAQISALRSKYGLKIDIDYVTKNNKFGNPVRNGVYSIKDKVQARNIYNEIQENDKE